jgi:hypothetical protein
MKIAASHTIGLSRPWQFVVVALPRALIKAKGPRVLSGRPSFMPFSSFCIERIFEGRAHDGATPLLLIEQLDITTNPADLVA